MGRSGCSRTIHCKPRASFFFFSRARRNLELILAGAGEASQGDASCRSGGGRPASPAEIGGVKRRRKASEKYRSQSAVGRPRDAGERGKKETAVPPWQTWKAKAVAELAPPSSARPPALPYTGKRHIRRRRSGMWEERRKAGEEAEERQSERQERGPGKGGRPEPFPAVDAHFLAQLPLLIALALQDLGAVLGLVGFLLQRLDLALHRLQRSCSGCHPGGGAGRVGSGPKEGLRELHVGRGGSSGGGGKDAAPVLAGGKQLGRGFDVSTAGGRGRDVATAGPAKTKPLCSPFGRARWGLRGGNGWAASGILCWPDLLARLLSPKRLLSGSNKGGSGCPTWTCWEGLRAGWEFGEHERLETEGALSASAPSGLPRVPALSRCLVQGPTAKENRVSAPTEGASIHSDSLRCGYDKIRELCGGRTNSKQDFSKLLLCSVTRRVPCLGSKSRSTQFVGWIKIHLERQP